MHRYFVVKAIQYLRYERMKNGGISTHLIKFEVDDKISIIRD